MNYAKLKEELREHYPLAGFSKKPVRKAIEAIEALEAEVAKVTSDRAYIIGANAGWEAAVEQGEATPAAAALLARAEAAEAERDYTNGTNEVLRGENQRLETALAAEWAKVAKLVEALNTIDALDPEGRIGDCSVNAISGLVLRMGEIARAAITEASQ